MRHRIIGILVISIGFSLPFVLKSMFPTFLYASIPTVVCFWAGFMFILSPLGVKKDIHIYLKWARYAIVLNALLSLVLTAYLQLSYYFESLNFVGYSVQKVFSFFLNPVGSVFEWFVPRPMVQQPDGSVLITFSFERMLFTNFFSLVVYAVAGIILKIIKDRKITPAFSGARGPCAR
jgi:hypothetical protein